MIDSIRVCCRTNLDECKNKVWPTKMACRPMIGDRVKSDDGYILSVVEVTHATVSKTMWDRPNEIGEPYLIVELHKRHSI